MSETKLTAKERIEAAMKNMSDKLKDSAETVQIAGMLAKDEIDKKAQEIKGELAAAQDQLDRTAERMESMTNSSLLKMQMGIEAAKDARKERIAQREEMAHEEYVNALIDYAEYCQALADVLTKEAQAALIEAEKESAEQ